MAIIIKDKNGNPTHIAGLGKQGPTGKSAYQYAVEAGFTGTESEFAARMDMYSNENLLDNWYFLDPINQRGQTEYDGWTYTIDRWFWYSSNRQGTATVTKAGIKLTVPPNGQATFTQRIEKSRFEGLFNPHGYTVSALTDKGLLSYHLNELSIYKEDYYIDAVPASILINNTAEPYTITIIAVKLELGPVQTLAHQDADGNWVLNDPPPNKALELAKCQRYQVVYNCNTAFSGVGSGIGIWESTKYWYITIPLSQPLYKTPTITTKGTFCISVSDKNTPQVPETTSIQVWGLSESKLVARFKLEDLTNYTGIIQGGTYGLETRTPPAQFIIDANL